VPLSAPQPVGPPELALFHSGLVDHSLPGVLRIMAVVEDPRTWLRPGLLGYGPRWLSLACDPQHSRGFKPPLHPWPSPRGSSPAQQRVVELSTPLQEVWERLFVALVPPRTWERAPGWESPQFRLPGFPVQWGGKGKHMGPAGYGVTSTRFLSAGQMPIARAGEPCWENGP
jgi:hypothetical protein